LNPRQFAITLLLLLPLLMLGSQLVNGQQYVTITNTVTTVQTSTVAIRTQTVTTTTAQPRPIFSAQITIPPTHGVCGVYFVQAFNATSGDILSGTLTMDNKADLYLIADKSFQAWSHQLSVVVGRTCAPQNPLILLQGGKSYNFSATIPSNGVYELVVDNLSLSTVTAQLNAALTTPTTAAITAYSTITQQVIQTLTQTSTQTAQLGGGPDLTTLAVGIIAVIVIVAIAYVALMKRRRTGKK